MSCWLNPDLEWGLQQHSAICLLSGNTPGLATAAPKLSFQQQLDQAAQASTDYWRMNHPVLSGRCCGAVRCYLILIRFSYSSAQCSPTTQNVPSQNCKSPVKLAAVGRENQRSPHLTPETEIGTIPVQTYSSRVEPEKDVGNQIKFHLLRLHPSAFWFRSPWVITLNKTTVPFREETIAKMSM